MVTLAEVPVVGPYEVVEPTGTTTYPTTDLLCDGSTATYIDIQRNIGASGVFPNTVEGRLGTGGTAVEHAPAIRVFGRIIADGPLQALRLQLPGGSQVAFWNVNDPAQTPIPSALGMLYPFTDGALGLLNHAIQGTFPVYAAASAFATREGTDVVRISEFWIVAMILSRAAPPARLFPREDGLGVGGGRIFPPPRSQQRSGRRFGYY